MISCMISPPFSIITQIELFVNKNVSRETLSRETYCTLQNNQCKGNATPKIDIRLLVYVRVYQLQCLYYFGYDIMITYII
nr:MAG TPA_asm: hypothetical protein [Caudoviricetes sp.]